MKDGWSPTPDGVPVFFLSYSRNRNRTELPIPEDPGSDEHVLKFYDDLCNHVRQLVGSRPGTVPGFIDQSMKPGVRWYPRLLRTLENARVFVALLSADYVDSPWCGMEWWAFARRRPIQVSGDERDDETTIVPVVWSPLAPVRVPPAVRAVQSFALGVRADGDLRSAYLDNGVYGLLAMNSPHYGAVVWHLARRISELYHTFSVPPLDSPLDESRLRNAFKGEA